MAHDVFVSHSSKDKPTADAVCAMLESQGIRCWVAPRDITPGMDWGEAIVHAVKGARVMVLVFSASANDSPQIKREVERAVNKGIPVIPLRIEDVAPTASLEYFISTPHWLDAFTPPLEGHLRYLAKIIQQIIGAQRTTDMVGSASAPASGSRATPEIPAQDQAQPVQTKARRVASPIVLLAGAVALLAISLAGWWFGIERPRREQSRQLIARIAAEQSQRAAAEEAAKRTEEKRIADAAAAKANQDRLDALNAIRIEEEKAKAAANLEAERQRQKKLEEEREQREREKATPPKRDETNSPVIAPPPKPDPVPPTNPPPVSPIKRAPTVFDLIKEANRSLGAESKDNLFYARSERSVGELTPGTWKLGFYDPAAIFKVVELKFSGNEKIGETRPTAVLERYNLQKVLDRKKLNIDSDQALQTAAKEPSLKSLTLKTSEMKLELTDGRPIWRIKLWAARIRNPNDSAELGEIWISSDDGKVVKNTLNPGRAN